MDKGKSSHASTAVNQVTLHEIADRSDMAIKGLHETTSKVALRKALCALGKPVKKRAMLGSSTTEASLTTEPHNNEQPTGYQELPMKTTM
jgi:hypothetical protein